MDYALLERTKAIWITRAIPYRFIGKEGPEHHTAAASCLG